MFRETIDFILRTEYNVSRFHTQNFQILPLETGVTHSKLSPMKDYICSLKRILLALITLIWSVRCSVFCSWTGSLEVGEVRLQIRLQFCCNVIHLFMRPAEQAYQITGRMRRHAERCNDKNTFITHNFLLDLSRISKKLLLNLVVAKYINKCTAFYKITRFVIMKAKFLYWTLS